MQRDELGTLYIIHVRDLGVMLSTIEFNSQFRLVAIEVKHVRLDWVLPSKREAAESPVAKYCPL